MATPSNTSPSPNKGAGDSEEALREELRQCAQRLKPFTDIFLDAYCVVDLSNRVVDFNVAFTELCGESYRKVLKIGDFCELLKTEHCPGDCPARQIVASKKMLRLDELTGVTKAFPQLQMILGGVPIFNDGGVLLGSLITIRNVFAEAELQKKYDERRNESVTDGLTRLFNKTYTESLLLRLVRGTLRDVNGLSVVMCDVDHFKKVNDTYGHRAGDHVLMTVAQMLRGETRETDIVGRVGGEEFLAILANSDVQGVNIFSERFRKRIEAAQIMFEGRPIPVTVSLGTATLMDRRAVQANADVVVKELVGQADTALYYAKANGRNRTCQAESLPKSEANGGKKKPD